MIKLRKILTPTDFSVPSLHALKYAAALAQKFESELHLVTVVEDAISLVPDAEAIFRQTRERKEEQKRVALLAIKKLAVDPLPGGHPVQVHVLDGIVHTEVVNLSTSLGIDLLVMGTHGRTGISHLLMGSVAEKLVRLAPCPVLTVRPDGHQFVTR